ncbi:unnamed protein product, partial [Strongylus vulgaris]
RKKKAEKIITVPKSCPFKEEILCEAEKARERIKAQMEAKKYLGRKKKAEKIITVPKSCPFKEEILCEAEKARERIKAQMEAKKVLNSVIFSLKGFNLYCYSTLARNHVIKEALKQARAEKRKDPMPTDLQSLSAKAAKEGEEFEKKQEAKLGTKDFNPLSDRSIKAYASEVRKMIESADIIIQVLDARDPLGSRSPSVEQQVLNSGKRLILLLNKIDLVPRENVAKWLAYLRTQMPTIAFKASTQEQNTNISRFTSSNLNNSSSAKCIGADLVMKLLGNYCRNKDIKTSIRVGIVGFPNVGKSSVINSLKRRRACNVGAMPGITKEIQEIELDKHIRLIDSPGVVLNDWNTGRLRYYTHPPEDTSSVAPESGVSAEIVSQFSKEFDIDTLDEDLKQLVEAVVVTSGKTKKGDRDRGSTEAVSLPSSLVIDGNVQLNRVIKKALKKNKRAQRKLGKQFAIC